MTRIDWTELLFSSTGRLGRTGFLGLTTLLLVLAVAFESMTGDRAPGWIGWIFYAALMFCWACILSKRLHDRGNRGWWAFLPVWALWVAWSPPHDLAQVPPFVILAATFMYLGLVPGQRAGNRFGPSLRPA